ncbi:hypothetical protein [Methylocapsa acidiphila]|uniref:hypothetical protein n=1 Tax=Methylocapsa acidiphila TaxID=133552 RepID=UPI000408BED5|nr:hypothetical protein [Methylocapsa acidiphila]
MPPEIDAERAAREALASNPFPPTPWVRIVDEGIVIATGYSEALNRLLRWMPKAKWRANKRSWLLPFSSAEALRAVLPEIARLADAAQELDEPAAIGSGVASTAARAAPDQWRTHVLEAAELLHGPDWETALGAAPDALAESAIAVDLAAGLRRKADAFARAAERLEQGLRTPSRA